MGLFDVSFGHLLTRSRDLRAKVNQNVTNKAATLWPQVYLCLLSQVKLILFLSTLLDAIVSIDWIIVDWTSG